MRFAQLVVGAVLCCSNASLSAAEHYLIQLNSPLPSYSPYQRGRLVLEFTGEHVHGRLLPLEGDSTPPVNVLGRLKNANSMQLSFSFPQPVNVVFRRVVGKEMITWKAPARERLSRQHYAVEGLYFFRYKNGEFADSALTLAQTSCGKPYGELHVRFSQKATAESIRAFIRTIPELANLRVDYELPNGEKKLVEEDSYVSKSSTLEAALIDLLSIKDEDLILLGVVNNPGVEAPLTRALRGSGLFDYVNLPIVACGGGEMSYIVINRDLLFDGERFSNLKFQNYVDDRLARFVAQRFGNNRFRFRFEEKQLIPTEVPPYHPVYRLRMFVASEVSRLGRGEWDSFFVVFRPLEPETIKKSEYALGLTVERLRSTGRSYGTDDPPDESWYKKERSFQDEAQVTTRIARFISEHDKGWCVYDLPSFEVLDALRTPCGNKHGIHNGGFRDPSDY